MRLFELTFLDFVGRTLKILRLKVEYDRLCKDNLEFTNLFFGEIFLLQETVSLGP